MVWIGGVDALPYVWPPFVIHNAIALVWIEYAKRKYAEYIPALGEPKTARVNLYFGLLLFLTAGLCRAHWSLRDSIGGASGSGFLGNAAAGFSWGVIVTPFALILGLLVGALITSREGRAAQGDENP